MRRSATLALLATTLLPTSLVAGCGSGSTDTSSSSPTASAPATSAFDVETGDCFNVLDEGTTSLVSRIDPLSCDQPHTYEAYYATTLTSYETFPGDDALATEAESACTPAFTDFVGEEPDYSDLSLKWFAPTQGSWENGDREVLCILTRTDGEQSTGSAEGTASESPSPAGS